MAACRQSPSEIVFLGICCLAGTIDLSSVEVCELLLRSAPNPFRRHIIARLMGATFSPSGRHRVNLHISELPVRGGTGAEGGRVNPNPSEVVYDVCWLFRSTCLLPWP